MRYQFTVWMIALARASAACAGENSKIDMQWLAKARTELNTVTLRYDKIAVRVEEISELTGGPTDDKQAKDDHRVLVQHNRWVRLANNVLRETAVTGASVSRAATSLGWLWT